MMIDVNHTNRFIRKKWVAVLIMMALSFLCLPLRAEVLSYGDIVFSANVSGQWDLWTMKPDSIDPARLTDSSDVERHPAVGPKGRELAFIGEKRRIWTMEPASGVKRLVPLPKGIYAEPAWSPDGNELVFCPIPGPARGFRRNMAHKKKKQRVGDAGKDFLTSSMRTFHPIHRMAS